MNGNGSLCYRETHGDGFDYIRIEAIINGFCSIDKWDEAKRLLADMVNKGISPNVYIVNALISALCKDGKIQEAISVFDLMTQRGIRPDVITYTTLIHAFCKFGHE
ncbi:pentatricopeptide repeat-containing protein [Gossypium australe]|uniref:Pentatricopeptide repeat-containing protein n=1 Tax=Gossypium australe TaxID=47621 RepID=A0A5B6WGT4_9ROSI|nr:pentatricopeptide repeat-containing protein [Gossypium australe]